jgi:hypothetical protein
MPLASLNSAGLAARIVCQAPTLAYLKSWRGRSRRVDRTERQLGAASSARELTVRTTAATPSPPLCFPTPNCAGYRVRHRRLWPAVEPGLARRVGAFLSHRVVLISPMS